MDSLITLLISTAAAIISGIALYIIKKNLAGREAEERQLRKDTERENVLILRSINAIGKLTLANSIALKDGKVNGEMSSAMREYEDVDRELYNYLLEINSKKR
ncbi:MAG: hypothetical protein SPF92_08490 [Clostridia bacterium]|nr:hypothetical protein [Clostridia bacterium]